MPLDYNRKEVANKIIDKVQKLAIKFEYSCFEKASMLDIWNKNNFIVIQFEENRIGLSIIEGENCISFSSNADDYYYSLIDFEEKLDKLLHSN